MASSAARSAGQLTVGARRRVASALVAAFVLALAPAARAYSDPDYDWWTVETPHFRVHYDRPLEPVASRVASLAEKIHVRISQSLGYTPTQLTEIVLTDDAEDANGSATALPLNTIRLYVSAPSDLSTIGDYDDWYTELVTHEYTHIAHTDNISGVPAIVNAVLGKTLAPNQVQPRWILEGLAVVSESEHTSAGRIRSNLFDMYLRADVLEGRIAGLDQVSSDAYRWPQGNLWYLYGSRFLAWITGVYGPNTMRAVAAEYGATVIPWGINRSIRRVTGRTYVELYEGFKDYLRRLYAEQVRGVEARGLREGTRITRHGRNVFYPRFAPRAAGGDEVLYYYRDDSDARPGLYRLALKAPKSGERPEELVARAAGPTAATFTPEGDVLFNGIVPFKNYYFRNDLFLLQHGEVSPQGDEGARHRLTEGRRAAFPDVSPDGRRVTFTVDVRGTSYLEIGDLGPDGKITGVRDLVPSARWEQAYTPRFSPDGRQVAYSVWVAGGFRDVRVVDVATGVFYDVTHDRALDMTPAWSPDGKTLYFASDRSGIFNVYAYDLAARTFAQVTNVRTGAFMPAVSADGRTLVYSGYGSYGHDLYAMPLDPARFLPSLTATRERPDPATEPEDVPLRRHPYNPLPTVAPRSYLLSLKPGSYSANAVTFTASGGDVVGIHGVGATITADPGAPSPTVALNYTYGRLPVDFSLNFFYSPVPRTTTVDNQTVRYNETDVGISTGVSYTHQEAFASHTLAFSYSVANFSGGPSFSAVADPYSPVPTVPAAGNIDVAHVGYSYSNIEGSLDASGSVRGFAVSVGFDYASPYTGSTFTVRNFNAGMQGYLSMPWPGHQTLALRAAGAVSGGGYPRNGAYYVGGYDIADNSLPSAVLSGVFNGSFVLRGYPPGVYSGSEYLLGNAEYRFPLVFPDHGISTLPLYLRRIDGNFFVDYGGAFNTLDLQQIRFFHHGALIDTDQLHASLGGELWFGITLGYLLDVQLRLGYAYGFSAEAIKGGQPYFVASTAF